MAGAAQKEQVETWGVLVFLIYLFIGFIIPIVGLCIGLYGLNKVGKRIDGLIILCVGIIGAIYMPYIWLVLFFTAGALH